jgi:hypothetical protein
MDSQLPMFSLSGRTALLRYPREMFEGIHLKNFADGCPITNVGHDREELRGFLNDWGRAGLAQGVARVGNLQAYATQCAVAELRQ